MSKEAIMFCIDTSRSMGETDPGKTQTRLAEAIEGVKLLVEAKLLQSKQNEVGVVLFGTTATSNPLNAGGGGYEHVTLLHAPERPRVSLTADLDAVGVGAESADLIDGLVVAVDVLHRRVGTKKYTKTIYLITAAEDKIESPDDLQATVQHMIDNDVNLVVVGINFTHTFATEGGESKEGCKSEIDDDGGGEDEDDDDAGAVKQGNERMLCSIARATQRGNVLSSSDLVRLMAALQTKAVRPVKNKAVLILPCGDASEAGGGSDHHVEVLVFARAKRAAPPSLKKESKGAYDPSDPKSGSVKIDRTYRNPLHPDEEVGPQNLVKGYRYGLDYVPVGAADAASMKVESERAYLQVLGFARLADLRVGDSTGDTKCVIPAEDSLRSEACVTALAHGLEQQAMALVCRFVGRKNADPQLVALQADPSDAPSRGKGGSGGGAALQRRLIMWQLPFDDDQRRFTFPSFDKAPLSQQPSAAQLAAADALVGSLMVDPEAFVPERVFNPLAERLRRAMVARVKDETCQLPGVDARVRAYMDPSPLLLVAARPAIEGFAGAFRFVPVESKGRNKRKHFWSDIAGAGAADAQPAPGAPTSSDGGGGAAPAPAKAPKVAAAAPAAVGSVDPVGDFEAMVAASPGLVGAAVAAMMARACELVTEGGTAAYYKKAAACAASLRRACLAHGESEAFNAWLADKVKAPFKAGRHAEAWELVAAAGTTLVSRDEDSAVDVTRAQAASFLTDALPPAAAAAAVAAPAPADASDDDMFGDME